MKWVMPLWVCLGCQSADTAPADGPMSLPPDDFYPGLDVPYVSTPDPIIDTMLALTVPRADETLMDLGCGDGRIVLTALERVPGLVGVGVDLDPARIREANTGAAMRGLTGRVRFLPQDLFATTIEADVVTLYLLPEVNMALRPTLWSALAPGARVVSHDFDMEDWEPDVWTSVARHRVYFWVIPASLGGVWVLETGHPQLSPGVELALTQGFQTVVGHDPDSEVFLRGRIDGHALDALVQPRVGEASRLIAEVVDTPDGQWLRGLYDLEPFSARRLTAETTHLRRVDPDTAPREH
jgi:hypothetical protein